MNKNKTSRLEKVSDGLYLFGVIWAMLAMVIGLYKQNICAVALHGFLFIGFELRRIADKISMLIKLGIYSLMRRDENAN